ncbi:MAG: methyltransferase, partial [Mesorhizobium sp.]
MFMQAGCDFFDDLAAAGLTESAAHAFAEATWHRIGYDVLAVLDALHDGFPP